MKTVNYILKARVLVIPLLLGIYDPDELHAF